MTFDTLNHELGPIIGGLDFEHRPTDIFLNTDAGIYPPTLSVYEHRIAAADFQAVSYLVQTGDCVDGLGRTIPTTMTYADNRPEYYLRVDVFDTASPVPTDPVEIVNQRVASLRTVIGSDVFQKIDAEAAEYSRWAASVKASGEMPAGTEALDDEEPVWMTRLVADLIVNRNSELWRSIECRHTEAEIEIAKQIPEAPQDLAALKAFIMERGGALGVETEFRTRVAVGRAIYEVLDIPDDVQEIVNFPMSLKLKPEHFSRLLGRVLEITISTASGHHRRG